MKTDMPMQALAAELVRQKEAKRDFITDHKALAFRPAFAVPNVPSAPPSYRLVVRDVDAEPFGINDTCHQQVATKLDIPRKYYERMREAEPGLLEVNVNHWLQRSDKRAMVRTLDGKARAFLSNSYQRLDHSDILGDPVVLSALADSGAEYASGSVTQTHLYMKFVFDKVQGEVTTGDVVRSGIMIRNSEVGLSSLEVCQFIERLICTNGMVSTQKGDGVFTARHLGARDNGSNREIFSDATRAATDKALVMQVRDAIRALASPAALQATIDKMTATTKVRVTRPETAVLELGKAIGLAESERDTVLEHLMASGDLSQWGLLNAVTRTAEDVASYDRASEMERLGGRILDLTPQQFTVMTGGK